MTEAGQPTGADLPIGFDLRAYLVAQERLYYVRALDQARGVGADAARLLGIEPASFRARAQTLGIRPRQPASRKTRTSSQ